MCLSAATLCSRAAAWPGTSWGLARTRPSASATASSSADRSTSGASTNVALDPTPKVTPWAERRIGPAACTCTLPCRSGRGKGAWGTTSARTSLPRPET
uniref:Uncharacterized protein n=1 Tax=Ixodes ricinus TaxID=34613 RepID=A0A6B0UFK0_IXORI